VFIIYFVSSDVQFWKKTDDLSGISIRSIFLNVVMQIIMLLYLIDERSSWLIIMSSGIGLIIEFWKITQILSINFKWNSRSLLPMIEISQKSSYLKETNSHDGFAMKYLSYAVAPLLIAYSVYSATYLSKKSWYSWFLNMLVGFVYTFGFVAMTPQLYINYKMKSVAHMPWKVFVYKALNTFIDDLFAFVVKMPILHRIACFRDDIIFIVYLYQRWIYPVDKSRSNEFGQVFQSDSDLVNEGKDSNCSSHDENKTNHAKARLRSKALKLS
jgi:hypothetical protein